MGKLIRYYNQNRIRIWLVILIIAFLILIIHTLNGFSKEENANVKNKVNQENTENTETTNQVNYTKESRTLVDGDQVPEIYQKDFGSTIDNFLQYCKNHEPEKAYDLLSNECKEVLYPTEEMFTEQYYNPKFSTDKIYDFQSWTAEGPYVYLVKIYNNTLATGKGTSEKYIQDYISVVLESGSYKINVNGFVGIRRFNNAEGNKADVSITVNEAEVHMDYSIATVVIKNNSDRSILLDSREDAGSIYVVDTNGGKSEALLYEILDEDLEVEAQGQKELKIKFSNSYQSSSNIAEYIFSDVQILGYPQEIKVEV